MSAHKHHVDGPSDCFGCKVKSISLGFTYGKDCFHGPTIAEKQEKLFKEQAAQGNSIESATRWV